MVFATKLADRDNQKRHFLCAGHAETRKLKLKQNASAL
jgi:hypothetical protein